jgi:hypothetical protein
MRRCYVSTDVGTELSNVIQISYVIKGSNREYSVTSLDDCSTCNTHGQRSLTCRRTVWNWPRQLKTFSTLRACLFAVPVFALLPSSVLSCFLTSINLFGYFLGNLYYFTPYLASFFRLSTYLLSTKHLPAFYQDPGTWAGGTADKAPYNHFISRGPVTSVATPLLPSAVSTDGARYVMQHTEQIPRTVSIQKSMVLQLARSWQSKFHCHTVLFCSSSIFTTLSFKLLPLFSSLLSIFDLNVHSNWQAFFVYANKEIMRQIQFPDK